MLRACSGGQRGGGDDVAADRDDPAAEIERRLRAGAGGEQHRPRPQRTARCGHVVAPGAAAQARHPGAFVDADPPPGPRHRQPVAEAADMQLRAFGHDDSPVVGGRPHLVPHPLRRHQERLRIRFALQRRQTGGHGRVMRRLHRQLDLAGADEVAVDRLLRDQPADRVHGGIERPVQRHGRGHAIPRHHGAEARREAVVAMAAVASGGAAAHAVSLQHRDAGAAPGQRQGGGQAGEAAADHGHVYHPLQRVLRVIEGGHAIQPIRRQFHPVRRTFQKVANPELMPVMSLRYAVAWKYWPSGK